LVVIAMVTYHQPHPPTGSRHIRPPRPASVRPLRYCTVCRAILASDNRRSACSCHPLYIPQHHVDFAERLLAYLSGEHPRQWCDPVRDFNVPVRLRVAVHREIDRLRHRGHRIVGRSGPGGGYRWLRGPFRTE
jgi:hypothetical protein